MTHTAINPAAEIRVPDYERLVDAWKRHGIPGTLVGRFIVEKPLTPGQLRRLPVALVEKLEHRKAASHMPRIQRLPGSSNVYIFPSL
jgi:hypothetical protein